MAVVLVLTNVIGVYSAEIGFWKERRQALDQRGQRQNHLKAQLALLSSSPVQPIQQLSTKASHQTFPINSRSSVPSLSPAHTVGNRLASLVSVYGSVREIHVSADPNAPFVVHIQDAHGIEEAQRNIAKIIDNISQTEDRRPKTKDQSPKSTERRPKAEDQRSKTGELELQQIKNQKSILIGLEGASGAFAVDAYRDFSDDDITKGLADYFLKEGYIGGPEYSALTIDNQSLVELWGIEDLSTYHTNIQAFKDSLKNKTKVQALVSDLKSSLMAQKQKVYSPELKQYEKKATAYQNHEEALGQYVKYLLLNQKAQIKNQKFKNSCLLIQALDREDSLDFGVVEKQRHALIKKLCAKLSSDQLNHLVQQSMDYKTGRMAYGAYYDLLRRLCQKQGMDLKSLAQFNAYIDYVKLSEKMNPNQLLEELSQLEKAVAQSLAVTPEQKKLVTATRYVHLLEKLIHNQMTPKDWEEYKQQTKDDSPIRQTGIIPGGKNPKTIDQDLPRNLLKPFEQFCALAIKRNKSLVDNLLNKQRAKGKETGVGTARAVALGKQPLPMTTDQLPVISVLVAGGFHTKGITELLHQKNASYMVVTPQITAVPKNHDYLNVFARDPIPLEKMLAGEKIFLAAERVMVQDVSQIKAMRGQVFQSLNRFFVPAFESALKNTDMSELEAGDKALTEVLDIEQSFKMEIKQKITDNGFLSVFRYKLGKTRCHLALMTKEKLSMAEHQLEKLGFEHDIHTADITVNGQDYVLVLFKSSLFRFALVESLSYWLEMIQSFIFQNQFIVNVFGSVYGHGARSAAADILEPFVMPMKRFKTWQGRGIYYLLLGVWEEAVFRVGGLIGLPVIFMSYGFDPGTAFVIGLMWSVPVFLFCHTLMRCLVQYKKNVLDWKRVWLEILSEFGILVIAKARLLRAAKEMGKKQRGFLIRFYVSSFVQSRFVLTLVLNAVFMLGLYWLDLFSADAILQVFVLSHYSLPLIFLSFGVVVAMRFARDFWYAVQKSYDEKAQLIVNSVAVTGHGGRFALMNQMANMSFVLGYVFRSDPEQKKLLEKQFRGLDEQFRIYHAQVIGFVRSFLLKGQFRKKDVDELYRIWIKWLKDYQSYLQKLWGKMQNIQKGKGYLVTIKRGLDIVGIVLRMFDPKLAQIQEIDLKKLLNNHEFHTKNGEFKLDNLTIGHQKVLADPMLLCAALEWIYENALKVNQEQGMEKALKSIDLSVVEAGNGFVELIVSNPKAFPRKFLSPLHDWMGLQPLFQVDYARRAAQVNTEDTESDSFYSGGVGMPAARMALEAMGATITAENSKDGTRAITRIKLKSVQKKSITGKRVLTQTFQLGAWIRQMMPDFLVLHKFAQCLRHCARFCRRKSHGLLRLGPTAPTEKFGLRAWPGLFHGMKFEIRWIPVQELLPSMGWMKYMPIQYVVNWITGIDQVSPKDYFKNISVGAGLAPALINQPSGSGQGSARPYEVEYPLSMAMASMNENKGGEDHSQLPDILTFNIRNCLQILMDPEMKSHWPNALKAMSLYVKSLGFQGNVPPEFRDFFLGIWGYQWEEEIERLGDNLDSEMVRGFIDELRQSNAMSLYMVPPHAIKGKTFVVRVDFNDVHFDPKEEKIDDIRLNASVNTMQYILNNGGKVVLVTHSGRPSGEGVEEAYDISHVRNAVSQLMNRDVHLMRGKEVRQKRYAVVTDEIIDHIHGMSAGDVAMLDNTRFDWREQSDDPAEREALAYQVSRLGDVFVLDGFPVSHRSDTTVVEMLKTSMPSVKGFWMERELLIHQKMLRYIKHDKRGSMAAIFGGIKEDKIPLIQDFSEKLRKGDKILIGGKLAGIVQERQYNKWIGNLKIRGVEVVLAEDDVDGLDIGPRTIEKYKRALDEVEAVYWNSPQGNFEDEPYHRGSYAIAHHIKGRIDNGELFAFVSGGETAPLVKAALDLDEEKRVALQQEEREIGETGLNMPVLTISTGGGTSTDYFAYERNIGEDSLWGISPYYLMCVEQGNVHGHNIDDLLEKVKNMPAYELLKALELHQAELVEEEVDQASGLTVMRVRVPERQNPVDPPVGIDVLSNELGPTRGFELLFDENGYLISIFPVVSEELLGEHSDGDECPYHYFDFSEFYFEIPGFDDEQAINKWIRFQKECAQSKEAITRYREERGLSEYVIKAPEPENKPFVFAEFVGVEQGALRLVEFGLEDRGFGQALEKIYDSQSENPRVIFPVFPTVYSPAAGDNYLADRIYMLTVYSVGQALGEDKEGGVLVVGPGTGIDAWVAWLGTNSNRDIYAVGINPFEVANMRFFAKQAGFRVTAKVGNNVLNEKREPVFGDKKIALVCSNSPFFETLTEEERKERIGKLKRLTGATDLESLSDEALLTCFEVIRKEYVRQGVMRPKKLAGFHDGDRGSFISELAQGVSQLPGIEEGFLVLWGEESNGVVEEVLTFNGLDIIETFPDPEYSHNLVYLVGVQDMNGRTLKEAKLAAAANAHDLTSPMSVLGAQLKFLSDDNALVQADRNWMSGFYDLSKNLKTFLEQVQNGKTIADVNKANKQIKNILSKIDEVYLFEMAREKLTKIYQELSVDDFSAKEDALKIVFVQYVLRDYFAAFRDEEELVDLDHLFDVIFAGHAHEVVNRENTVIHYGGGHQILKTNKLALFRALANIIQNAQYFIAEMKDDITMRGLLEKQGLQISEREVELQDISGKMRIETEIVNQGKDMEIRISDNAQGIPLKIRDSVFERGVSSKLDTGGRNLSRGLGLHIAKKCIERCNGTISFKTRHVDEYPQDHGTTFVITLPLGKSSLSEEEWIQYVLDQTVLPQVKKLSDETEKLNPRIEVDIDPVQVKNQVKLRLFLGESEEAEDVSWQNVEGLLDTLTLPSPIKGEGQFQATEGLVRGMNFQNLEELREVLGVLQSRIRSNVKVIEERAKECDALIRVLGLNVGLMSGLGQKREMVFYIGVLQRTLDIVEDLSPQKILALMAQGFEFGFGLAAHEKAKIHSINEIKSDQPCVVHVPGNLLNIERTEALTVAKTLLKKNGEAPVVVVTDDDKLSVSEALGSESQRLIVMSNNEVKCSVDKVIERLVSDQKYQSMDFERKGVQLQVLSPVIMNWTVTPQYSQAAVLLQIIGNMVIKIATDEFDRLRKLSEMIGSNA